MELFILFIFGVLLLSVWEMRGGPRWRVPVVWITCAVIAFAFTSQRVV